MIAMDNEKGTVLVVALIVLGLLMVIGTAITMSSSIELKIARNEKVGQKAFYRAESGRILAARITRSVLSGISYTNGQEYEAGSNVFVEDGDFPFEVQLDPGPDPDPDPFNNVTGAADVKPDVTVQGSDGSVLALVDVDKIGVGPLPGSSAEFGSGYEGVGKSGSAQAIYRIESRGRAAGNALSRVEVQYRMVP